MKIKGAEVASCTKVTNENLVEMRRVMEEAEQRVKQSNLMQVPLPPSSTTTSNFENSFLVLVLLIQKVERGLLDELRRHSIWVHVK